LQNQNGKFTANGILIRPKEGGVETIQHHNPHKAASFRLQISKHPSNNQQVPVICHLASRMDLVRSMCPILYPIELIIPCYE
jgi:hypothetical protein